MESDNSPTETIENPNLSFSGLLVSLNNNDSEEHSEKGSSDAKDDALHSGQAQEASACGSCPEAGTPIPLDTHDNMQCVIKSRESGHVEDDGVRSDEKVEYVMQACPLEEQMCTGVQEDWCVQRELTPNTSEHQSSSPASSSASISLDEDVKAAIKTATTTIYERLVQYVDVAQDVDMACKPLRPSPRDMPNRGVSPANLCQEVYPEDSDAELCAGVASKLSQEEQSSVSNDLVLTPEISGKGSSPTYVCSSDSPGAVKPPWSPIGQELDHNKDVTPEEKVADEEYGEASLPLNSAYQESDPVEDGSDVDEEKQSKSLSLSPREEQHGYATPLCNSSGQGFDPLDVDSDVDEEKRSKSLSISPKEEQYRETTPPPTSACKQSHPIEVASDMDEEKLSKPLSLLPRDDHHGDGTQRSNSSGQGFDPLDVDSDLDEEKPSKSFSLSPKEEQYGDATPPSTATCQGSDPLDLDSNVDEGKQSKSLSLSPRDEHHGDVTPPANSSGQGVDPLDIDSDVDEEKRSKSLSLAPRAEQYGDATPPLTSTCQWSDPLDIASDLDEEKQSKSLSLSPREAHHGDATPPSNSSDEGFDPLDVDSDLDKEKRSKSLSSSPRDEQYGDATPPLDVDIAVDIEKRPKCLTQSPKEDQYVTPSSTSPGQDPPDIDSDVNKEKPSKSSSLSPREEQLGKAAPPSTSTGYDPLDVDNDMDEEKPSKSLSLLPTQEQYGDATPPFASTGQDPLDVDSDVNEEKPSKSSSPSSKVAQYGVATPASTSTCQGSDLLDVDSDVDEEKPSKSLSLSPRQEQYGDATPPFTSTGQDPVDVDSDVDEEKPSKSLSLSPGEEQYGNATPPSTSPGHEPMEVDSDVDEGKPSKSLSISPRGEQYCDATPPSTTTGQEFEPLEFDREKPSKSLSLSPREQQYENVTVSSTSTGQDHLNVDRDVDEEKPSKPLSPSLVEEQKGDGTQPLSSTQQVAFLDVDNFMDKEKPSKSLNASPQEELEGAENPSQLDFVEGEQALIKNVVSKSLSSSPQEGGSGGRSPERDCISQKDSIHGSSSHGSHSSVDCISQKDSIHGSSSHGSHSSVCSNDDIHRANKPDSISTCQELVQVDDDDGGGVILREKVSSKSSTRSLPHGEQNKDLSTLTEDDHKGLTPEPLKPKSGSQVSSPALACLDNDIQAASTSVCEGCLHQVDILQDEDMASKSLSPSPSNKQYTGVTPAPTTLCEELKKEDLIKTCPHDETFPLQELSQNASSVSPSCTQGLITDATGSSIEMQMGDDSVVEHQREGPTKSMRHSPQEVKISVPQILEKYFSDAIKTCSSTIFQALLSQVEEYSDAMKVGKASTQGEELAQSKTDVRTLLEQEGDSPSELLLHKSHDQRTTRDILGPFGELDGNEDNTLDNLSLSGEEAEASDQDDSAEGDSSSPPPYTPPYNKEPRKEDIHGDPDEGDEDGEAQRLGHSSGKEEDEREEEDGVLQWKGPDELELSNEGIGRKIIARRDLHADTVWGPYPGSLQSNSSADDGASENSSWTLVCEDPDCWITCLALTTDPKDANCTIYSQGEELFCKVTRDIFVAERLVVALLLSQKPPSPIARGSPLLNIVTPKTSAVKEEPPYPAALHTDIQLLPQQAGMAAILATAVVNKDIFPCKDCGIWYRSERNLQAHLMYYCASRQKQPAAASSPPQDKPKESYPNERICPFPQCNKSCPSASSLEIHMRTHSGERPFVCLICLSAFTTKANCERHLKVHTDTLNGVCHGCGFVSTTRDILYSHLVTSHMVCQPGSHSEVCSPGPGLPKLPMSTVLSPGDSGVVLKCQVCGHNSDSPSQLQQHVRTHLEVRVPTERSPTPRQSTPSSVDQLQPSTPEGEPLGCVPKSDSSSPGANGGSATPRGSSPPDAQTTTLRIKEEPRSESETEEHQMDFKEDGEEVDQKAEGKSKERQTTNFICQTSNSPKSPATPAVKAEPTSPTPGCSPSHIGGAGSVFPGGSIFLPQYLFNPETAIMPQASEILAKMSEMVHSRLKQGQTIPQNNAATLFPSAPTVPTATATPLKGATCFECDITFNNINNFYVHKRLYCSSRHHGESATSASGPGSARDTSPATVLSSKAQDSSASPHDGAVSRAASTSPPESEPAADSGAAESKRVLVKTETPTGREGVSSSSEGEGVGSRGRASEGSQSPASGSAEDLDDDPSRTFCEACNIRFSRHENYTVHKRFYCASRHDPSNQRAIHMAKATTIAAFHPQPIRTRKRKKMYEIHMARTKALEAAAAAAASAPSPSVLGLAVKQEVSPSGAGSSSPEGDGPIDLSKRPRLKEVRQHGTSSILPALPLTDYHKCTACSISFNSIENYLAHKTYYCPATTLQQHTLEQLHRLKRSASTSPKSKECQDLLRPMESKALPADWVTQAQGSSTSPHTSALTASDATSPPDAISTLAAAPKAGATGVSTASSSQMVCPYCPNRPITCDLMEHFKAIHGLVVSIQSPQEAQPQSGSRVSPSPSLSPRDGVTATTSSSPSGTSKLVPHIHRDSINGQARRDTTSPSSPLINGSPSGEGRSPSAGSPQPVSPSRAPLLSLSPVPDHRRETVGISHLPDKTSPTVASHALPAPLPAPIPGPKTPVISLVQNGNSRYCRLCNIKFSSLSTFIAHKKYYCSSHSAEHVK